MSLSTLSVVVAFQGTECCLAFKPDALSESIGALIKFRRMSGFLSSRLAVELVKDCAAGEFLVDRNPSGVALQVAPCSQASPDERLIWFGHLPSFIEFARKDRAEKIKDAGDGMSVHSRFAKQPHV
jgi:hypothetical protein